MDATNAPASSGTSLDELKKKGIDFAVDNGPRILTAIVILVVGWLVANWVARMTLKSLEKKNLEPPIKMLITRCVRLLVLGLAAITALAQAGVNVITLVAGVSVIGVGVGLAMQGVLSNMVAGLTIIFTKPFRVGEYVQLAGVEGQVTHIELFATTLVHSDRSRVVVPNRKIVGEILHNYGGIRQLSISLNIAYGSDAAAALKVIEEILAANKRVLKEPSPVLGVSTLADGSISIAVCPWTAVPDAGPAGGEINQAIADAIRNKKLNLPAPYYREIRMLNTPGS